jgi:transposase
MATKSELDRSQRREAVLMLLRREEPAVMIARRFGISEPTLSKWRDDFLAGGEAALGNGRSGRKDHAAEEIKQLKRALAEREQVIGELTVANRIFKKLSDGLS